MVLLFASRHTPDRDANQDSGIHGDSGDEDVGEIHYVPARQPHYTVPLPPRSNEPKSKRLLKIKRWINGILATLLLVASLVGVL